MQAHLHYDASVCKNITTLAVEPTRNMIALRAEVVM